MIFFKVIFPGEKSYRFPVLLTDEFLDFIERITA